MSKQHRLCALAGTSVIFAAGVIAGACDTGPWFALMLTLIGLGILFTLGAIEE